MYFKGFFVDLKVSLDIDYPCVSHVCVCPFMFVCLCFVCLISIAVVAQASGVFITGLQDDFALYPLAPGVPCPLVIQSLLL